MSHSFTSLLYHLVFAVQGRLPLIPRRWFPEIRRYTSGILSNHRGELITAGGMPDHLHVLASLPPTMSLSKGVQLIKGNTSRWLSNDKGLRPFCWQEGYGGFTVSRSQLTRVQRYIENQAEHHRKRNLDEELASLFKMHETMKRSPGRRG